MPELPEVETVMRGLRPKLEGRLLAEVIQRRADLRFPLPENFAASLRGRRVERMERRAKYILIHLDGDLVLFLHLGMSGRIVILPPGEKPPLGAHDHVVFVTDAGDEIRYSDPRRFGMMDLTTAAQLAAHKAFRHLGPEPLGNAFNGPVLAERLRGKRTTIKAALLDQRVVAGVGNIYACEALYEAGISPKRLAYTVQGKRAEALASAVRSVLERAIASGGSSLRDYVQASGELGYFQHEWRVYGREGEPCHRCAARGVDNGRANPPVRLVKRLEQSGRSTFYCPGCQR